MWLAKKKSVHYFSDFGGVGIPYTNAPSLMEKERGRAKPWVGRLRRGVTGVQFPCHWSGLVVSIDHVQARAGLKAVTVRQNAWK